MDINNIIDSLGLDRIEWLTGTTLGFTHQSWILFFLAVFFGLFLKKTSQPIIGWARAFTGKTKNKFDDQILAALEKPLGGILSFGFWLLCVSRIEMGEDASFFLNKGLQIALSFYLVWAVYRMTDVFVHYLEQYTEKTENELDDHLVPLLSKTLKVFVVVFGALVAIQNLGINVMSLLAGLGLGGLAFALAAKDTAANLFGSVMILIDRPFKVGDWIVVDGAEGTVEDVGLRSTRIRTFHNSQISIPNSKTANANIDNMGRRKYRRVYARLGITYSSRPAQVEAFRDAIREIIANHPDTWKGSFHVYFNAYGDSALEIMVYFFLEVPDWAKELAAKEDIYLQIMKAAEKVGVSFAFPSQSIYVESLPEMPTAPQA